MMRANSQEVKSGRAKQRERTQRAVLAAAVDLMREGKVPTVEEAAAAADVSSATGYRYFASQGALIEEALRTTFPQWDQEPVPSLDMNERIDTIVGRGFPNLSGYEAIHRAALRLALDQWIKLRAGEPLKEPPAFRGGRLRAVEEIMAPIERSLDRRTKRRLRAALGVVIGIESLVVLRDVFDLNDKDAEDVLRWMCKALAAAATDRRL